MCPGLTSLCVLLVAVAGWAAAPVLTPDDIATSTRIPSVGHEVRFAVRLTAPADAPLRGDVTVTLDVSAREVARQTVTVDLAPGKSQDVPLSWTPTEDGWHTLVFGVATAAGVARLTRTLPVTARPLYFVWFGAPRDFAWCNVPTTVKPADAEWWRRQGALPCQWKAGVCNKAWSTEQFTDSYNLAPCIAIDEVGGLDALGEKIMSAVRAHRQAHPDGFRVIWFMGTHRYWGDYTDCVDLFVPEVYLNYRGNHLGTIDTYVRGAREAGVIDRVIPGLGINIVRDAEKRPTVTPTREDVLRQIRYLKTVAPELPGVGFFTSSSAAPGVAEYADQLCGEYYVRPVLTLVPGSMRAQLTAEAVTLTASLGNRGGMAARGACVAVGTGYGDAFRAVSQHVLADPLAAGEGVTVTATVPREQGVHTYSLRLVPQPGTTVLNESVWIQVAASLPEPGLVLCRPPLPTSHAGLACFAPVALGPSSALAYPLGADGARGRPVAACTLPGLPGSKEHVATWVAPEPAADQPQAFQLAPAPAEAPPPAAMGQRTGDILTVTGAGYVATLDLVHDQITSLKSGPASPELLGSPWRFSCTGYEGFRPAEVRQLPGGLVVTIPFANGRAEGSSRYLFYSQAALIRLERWFVPQQEMQATSSSEGCSFPQHGGVYALQAGPGGPVQRGELHDSSAYRDLLFGYLGGAPGPDNADKAGWFDCSWTRDGGGGLGVAIERRWEAAHSDVSYDVTRYYDGGDSIQVMNLWGKGLSVSRPQSQIVYLLPHAPLALENPTVVPPAQALWDSLHNPATMVAGGS